MGKGNAHRFIKPSGLGEGIEFLNRSNHLVMGGAGFFEIDHIHGVGNMVSHP